MLTALNALIDQAEGNRKLLLLRQLWELSTLIGGTTDAAPNSLFDEMMAHAASDLDDGSIAVLHAELGVCRSVFPEFSTLVTDRAAQIAAQDAAAVSHHVVSPGELGAPVSAEAPAALPGPAPAEGASKEAPFVERRSRPRNDDESNRVVAGGDRDAIIVALNDASLAFSRSALTTIVELAVSDLSLKEALVGRNDLPEPIIERLLPFLRADLKARALLSGAPFSAHAAAEAFEQAQNALVEAYRDGQRLASVDACVGLVQENRATTEEIVVLLAKDLRPVELAAFLARTLSLRLETALNALGGRLDHAAVVLLKAADIGSNGVVAVMDMRRRCGCRTARETASAVAIMKGYLAEDARKLITVMDGVSSASASVGSDPIKSPLRLAA